MKLELKGLSLFLGTIFVLGLSGALFALAATTDSFTVATTVSNVAPVIEAVQANAAGSPAGGTSTFIQVRFNVSDQNAQTTLNDSAAYINLTQAAVTRQSSFCTGTTINSTHRTYLCNVSIWYYDAPGIWNVIAYTRDDGGLSDTKNLTNFTMGNTDDITIDLISISFIGSPGTQDVQSSPGNVTVANTGNQNYGSLDLTAFNLIGGEDQIDVGNFSINVSNSPNGQFLINNSAVTVTGATIPRGQGSVEELYIYLDVPAGIGGTSYSSENNWVVDPAI